jgi:hypothetical protein
MEFANFKDAVGATTGLGKAGKPCWSWEADGEH